MQSKETVLMPEICRFLGIIITMYYKEHGFPHFHAIYNGKEAVFSIMDLLLIEGKLPKRVISLVLEWAFDHREELLENWKLLKDKKSIKKIKPLV
jgi:hypothetical protein